MRRIFYTAAVLVLSFKLACAQSPQGSAPIPETSGPSPSVAVQQILDRTAQLKQPQDVLTAADNAIKLAEQTSDHEGLALAYRLKAKAYADLKLPADALEGWRHAAQEFEKAGDSPGQIESLARVGSLQFKKEPAVANELFAKALELGKTEKTRPIAAARALRAAGDAIYRFQDVQPAKSFYSAALEIEEKLEPDSFDVAHTYMNFSQVDGNIGDLEKARAILEKVAPDSVELSTTLLRLVNGGRKIDDPDGTHMLEQALRIAEKHRPASDELVAAILNTFGIAATVKGDFSEARAYWERVRAIDATQPEDPEQAETLVNLGIVAKKQGDLTAARDYCQRALVIQQRLSPNPDGHVSPLVCLGQIALDGGDYVSAKSTFQDALAIQRRLLARTPRDGFTASGAAEILENLAEVDSREGDFSAASEYVLQALEINTKIFAADRPIVAETWLHLGQISSQRGQFRKALDYDKRALSVLGGVSSHSESTVTALIEMGSLYYKGNHLELARSRYQQALAIWDQRAPLSRTTAQILEGLGDVSAAEGHLQLAEKYYRKSLQILEKAFGPESPDVGRGLTKFAEAEAQAGEVESAFDSALRAEQIGSTHLRVTIQGLSERQALLYSSSRPAAIDLLMSLLERKSKSDPQMCREAWDAVTHSRVLVLDEMAARHQSVVTASDPGLADLADKLASARERLANVTIHGLQGYGPEIYRKLLDRTRTEKEQLEDSLAEKSLVFRQQLEQKRIGFGQVSSSLAPNAALVAYVRYSRLNFDAPVSRGETFYAAFVIRAGEDEPSFIPLGSAKNIETLWSAWRKEINDQARSTLLSQNAESRYRLSAAALRRVIWDPVAARLGNAANVFIVPDGVLYLVNFDALPFGKTQYLAESAKVFHYLSAERDLPLAPTAHGSGMLAVGSPDFNGLPPNTIARQTPSVRQIASAAQPVTFRGARSACGTFRTLRFAALPGSGREAEEVVAAWKNAFGDRGTTEGNGALALTGADAGPIQFKELAPGKRILHLATHGFFLEEECDSVLQKQTAEAPEKVHGPLTGENPLLLSGLAFAGANDRSRPDSDGIVTAEEIAAMNLEGVDLAVLSACDTGLGQIKSGEGVFGLRRAFQLAGASSVVMSLWSVDDEMTRAWMSAMYHEYLVSGKSAGESVRSANLKILRQRRAKGLSTHPFYWAAFIAAGNRE